MTEKFFFAYKLFLPLNISDFIFYVKIAPLKKSSPSFPAPPLKVDVLSSPPNFLEIWLEAEPPLQKGRVHTMWLLC